jgi:polyferredoxin
MRLSLPMIGNIILVAGLVVYGFTLFAEYFAKGKWAKNVTGLLAGLGMLTLAVSLIVTPRNAEVITLIARTRLSDALLWLSTALLLAAIASFGIITYMRPLRLWHERKIERDLNSELPRIP